MSDSKIEEGIRAANDFIEGRIEDASTTVEKLEESFTYAAESNKRFPKAMKVFGVLLLVAGSLHAISLALVIVYQAYQLIGGQFEYLEAMVGGRTMVGAVVMAAQSALGAFTSLFGIILGVRLLKNSRTQVSKAAKVMALLEAISLALSFMTAGLGHSSFISIAYILFLAFLSVYADPRLRRERLAKRRAQELEDKEDQEAGVLGLDKTGKGYIELDFFNMFWIFLACCFIGLAVELAYHMIVIDPGVYQDRAGLLYGPFSPIYGFGGLIITIVLNRFYDKNPVMIFLVSAFIGAFFEYLVSWWMETSFGIKAWDYSGTFLNIDGRTNFKFFCMWGCLGVVWVRWLLPKLLALINRIPWNWRYSLTVVCTAAMLIDCGLTVASLDCWYARQSGMSDVGQETAIERFCDQHYGDSFMQERFQTMNIDPSKAIRVA